MNDFPFNIVDIVYLSNLHIRHKSNTSYDVDCPFCGEHKGKLNINIIKNVFKCNRCGEKGGMLTLYGKLHKVDNSEARKQILDALEKGEIRNDYTVFRKEIEKSVPEVMNAPVATEEQKNKIYNLLFSLLVLTETHKQKLLDRGFTEKQISQYGYKSTPAYGYSKLTQKIIEKGGEVKGVPGFYQKNDKSWTIKFHAKSCGIMIPIKNIDGLIVGIQIRLDYPYHDRKYMWLSSINEHMGASSGSPIHLVGEVGAKTLFMTEGALKGDLSNALSGRTFACVPGVNQYSNLIQFLQEMKSDGTEFIYESYDMDKLMKISCKSDCGDKCRQCELNQNKQKNEINNEGKVICPQKQLKRLNIQRGCRKLREVCKLLQLANKSLTWDLNDDGEWNGNLKGIDNYLYYLK